MNKKTTILSLVILTLGLSSQLVGLAFAADIIPESSIVTDTTFPSDVANVKAVAADGKVTLTWDMATDNVAVKGYKLFYGLDSVTSESGAYSEGPIDLGNVLTYDVKGLENGKTYYFALTAYDAAGNESEFYSTEVSATPKVGGTSILPDTTAPKVVSASAVDLNTVSVKFSEAVKLPLTKPEAAFSVKEDTAGVVLAVSQAKIDATDKSGKTVLLTTSNQKKGIKYVLTAGIQLQDLSGNPIVSGTSDTAVFTGVDTKAADLKPAADATVDSTPPTFTSVKALDANTVEVLFSEPVVLSSNATENFIVIDAADNTKITNVKKVTVAQNGLKVTLTTDNLEAKKYNLVAMKVKDTAGNAMAIENSATSFEGVATTTTGNTVTPTQVEDAASDLIAQAMANLVANLSWKTTASKMANVANFVLYMSTDRGATYGDGVVLNKDTVSYDFQNLQANMVYYFKLTTRDKTGAESKGLITYLTLPGTGPELGLLFLGSASLSAWFTRRKKQ